MGYQILAVSPDQPSRLREAEELLADEDVQFTLFSDSDMSGARAFGISFRLDDQTFDRYKNRFNLDLEAWSGKTHHQLPVPALYILDKKGVIQFEYINPDYKVRCPPEVVLAAGKAALK